ncbi:hypothetical protein TYRP_006729 [Tyrophagus putrescentiae]|nr:hypothetical protein TYRP_006729 [Tyrophagus putrescentiae]
MPAEVGAIRTMSSTCTRNNTSSKTIVLPDTAVATLLKVERLTIDIADDEESKGRGRCINSAKTTTTTVDT